MKSLKESICYFARKFLIWSISLLVFKALFLIGILTFQSCQKDNDHIRTEKKIDIAVNDLEQAAIESLISIQEILIDNPLTQDQTLGRKNAIIKTEKRIKYALAPLVEQSKLLLHLYGVTNDDLERIIDDRNDPILALMGLAIISEKHTYTSTKANAEGFLLKRLYANNQEEDDSPDWYDCLLRSVGISAVIELASGQINKIAILKAIKKTARKTLGYFGVALAIYEFGECMEYY